MIREEDSASSNAPRMCIEAKAYAKFERETTRVSKTKFERDDTSVKDKLEEGRVGLQTITSKLSSRF